MIEKIVGIIAILLWLFLYTGGIVIGTSPYRQTINEGGDFLTILQAWLIVTCFYTLSNVAMLCCLSAIIGAICAGVKKVSIANQAANGLFVYLILISGLLLLGASPFENLAQAQYTRLAGTSSLFAFLVGYNPKMLGKLVSRLEEMAENRKSDRETNN